MKSRNYGTQVVVEIVVVIAVLAFVNLLSLRFFSRVDLTEGKIFTISDSTKKLLKGLDDVVNIKVYFSKKLPPYLTTLRREVRDILDEYRACLLYTSPSPRD